MITQVIRVVLTGIVLILVSAPRIHGQASLVAARQLYASAEWTWRR